MARGCGLGLRTVCWGEVSQPACRQLLLDSSKGTQCSCLQKGGIPCRPVQGSARANLLRGPCQVPCDSL